MIDQLVFWPWLAWAACAWAQTTPVESGQRWVLLSNGEVFIGEIVETAGTLAVRTGPGSEVRFSRDKLRCVGGSWNDLVQYQWARLPPKESRPRLALAEWCLRHGLTFEASQLLSEASQLPHDPQRLAAIQDRLQHEVLRRRQQQVATQSPAPTASSQKVPSPTAAAKPPKELSPELLAAFTSKIQPLLINRCGNTHCHGRGTSTEFELVIPNSRNAISSGLTRANLTEVQEQLTNRDYAEPSLLRFAAIPHGAAKEPPLSIEQLDRLSAWASQVSGLSRQQLGRETSRSTPSLASHAVPASELPLEPSMVSRAAHDDFATPSARASTSASDAMMSVEKTDAAKTISPFDPTSYNERYAIPRQPRPTSISDEG